MKNRIKELIESMSVGTIEREEVLALALLSALSGESIFLLGLPGVGKSMVARRLKTVFQDATAFEYLMSRFSTPYEIFGPVSISKLKNADCYERVTASYLPEAEVVFLDEIWKAGPAIQNSLLTVLNEKIYHNGDHDMPLPLKGIIAASNELPAEDEGLEALWDRFLLRYIVNPIHQKKNFFTLIDGDEIVRPVAVQAITQAEYDEIVASSKKVVLPSHIKELLYTLRLKMNKMGDEINNDSRRNNDDDNVDAYYVSDRRWKKAVGVIKMSAFLNDRHEVNMSDVLLLSHMLWNDETMIPTVNELIANQVTAVFFAKLVEHHKSNKRHVAKKSNEGNYYSPDGTHYVVQCTNCTFRLKISNYELMANHPNEFYYASEVTDGQLEMKQMGQYVMRVYKKGHVCINGYNYPLLLESEAELGNSFLADVNEELTQTVSKLKKEIAENIFVKDASIIRSLSHALSMYKRQLEF